MSSGSDRVAGALKQSEVNRPHGLVQVLRKKSHKIFHEN